MSYTSQWNADMAKQLGMIKKLKKEKEMEILFRGTPPEELLYEGTCGKCNTRVRFQKREAKAVGDCRNGEMLLVSCPVCAHPIYGYKMVNQGKEVTNFYNK